MTGNDATEWTIVLSTYPEALQFNTNDLAVEHKRMVTDMLESIRRTPAYSLIDTLITHAPSSAPCSCTPGSCSLAAAATHTQPSSTAAVVVSSASTSSCASTTALPSANSLGVELAVMLVFALPPSIWSQWHALHQACMATFITDNKRLLNTQAIAEVNALQLQIDELIKAGSNGSTSGSGCSDTASSSSSCCSSSSTAAATIASKPTNPNNCGSCSCSD